IVTIGKSIGNGHPLSAVITTEELANQFNNGMEYFNSFGGNPVSSAIGHTVLKIIEDDELQKNALNVGFYLKKELLSLKKTFEIIGDVRGEGLFLGIEIVAETNAIKPNPKAARYIVNKMKELGVLLSTDGPDNNVIKIKPPIIFNNRDADFLLNKLDKTISLVSKK
ncbi:MAG: aspartate aminotransferase family protein, partial [Candidatus Marinimicrobia bacterium]|nr:aspartate aminotransferase family protein [Candidatus Neomarinimicrobiota bacterium]